jgi:hypothetical protein|tara:strand:- start:278 stop:997 length:720 start_codon:yes stop_codon:yes gene_type:complete
MKKLQVIPAILLVFGISFSTQSFGQAFMGLAYDIEVTNPARLVAAMDKINAALSRSGRVGYPILNRYIVNGESPATHNVVVVYPTVEDMDKANAENAVSQDWAIFQKEVAESASQVGELLYQAPGISVGDPSIITSSNSVSQWILMDIIDSEKYIDAWLELAEKYQSDKVFSQLIVIAADGERGATHNLIISANSMSDLMENPVNTSRGWSRYLSKVSEIRTVISRNIVTQVKSYAPKM